jgi:hypothetical protein
MLFMQYVEVDVLNYTLSEPLTRSQMPSIAKRGMAPSFAQSTST